MRLLQTIGFLACTVLAQANEEILPELHSIHLIGSQKLLSFHSAQDEGVTCEDLEIPGRRETLTSTLSDRFLHQPLTTQTLEEIKECIVEYYRHRDRPIVFVQIPEQDVTSGTLQVLVLESHMGKVSPSGNKYFKTEWLKKQIRQKEGHELNVKKLTEDLTWINRNPFIQADAIFTPGQTPGTTDIDLAIQDRWPYRFYAGMDNTGVPTTGHNRYYAGMNLGNLWGIAHQFNYQFTCASHYDDFWAHTGQYIMPLPWRHIWQFYGGYSHVEAPIRATNQSTPFTTQGYSWQVSTRYAIPLPEYLNFLNEVNLGFDFKRTNNNINLDQPGLSSGTEFVFGGGANIGQFMLGYNSGYEKPNWKINVTLEAYYQPCPMGFGDQSNRDYGHLREFAKNHYAYVRGQVFPILRFPKIGGIFWYLNFRGQYANENLLSSEQMTVGGYDTVRGYDERQLNGDSAILFSTELRSPIFPLFKKDFDSLQFLGFFDYGTAYVHKQTAGEPKHQTIYSVGPGLRYSLNRYVTTRVDLGFQLKQVEGLHFHHHHKWHFAVTGSY